MDGSHFAPRAGFDFSESMRHLCRDMCHRLTELHHIDVGRILFSWSRSRKPGQYGTWASLTPLRFENGAETGVRGGKRYRVQRVVDQHGREMLYILSCYLPRFLDLTFTEKLTTIVHELWHISPDFNGDIRRFPGRYYVHTRCEDQYDEAMKHLAMQWLAAEPAEPLYEFLQSDFREIVRQHGAIYGARVSQPRLLRVDT